MRVRLPDGSIGVYMGQTGKDPCARRRRPRHTHSTLPPWQMRRNIPPSAGGIPPHYVTTPTGASKSNEKKGAQKSSTPKGMPPSAYPFGPQRKEPISEDERRRLALRAKKQARMKARAEESKYDFLKKLYTFLADKIYMRRMGLSIDVESLIKGVITGALVLFFALLQTTVFAGMRPFGAIPDLLLPLVIAVSITEGEKWGSVTGLCAAILIEAMGTTVTSFLPLLYTPVGYTVGIIATRNYKDSFLLRTIYTCSAGVLRGIFTAIGVSIAYDTVPWGLVITSVIIPEYFSTIIMSVLPHTLAWLSLKSFHKSRAERVN